jgi:hypothetical protein
MSEMAKMTIKMKNRIFAIPAEAAAMPPKPKTAAMIAMMKKMAAQYSMTPHPGIAWRPTGCRHKQQRFSRLGSCIGHVPKRADASALEDPAASAAALVDALGVCLSA